MAKSNGTAQKRVTEGPAYFSDWSPDGRVIAFAFGRIVGDGLEGQLEAIWVINSDGTGLREVVPARAGLEHPDWSPDGRSIVFNIAPENPGAPDSGAIMSVRPDGHGIRVLVQPRAELGFFKPEWSPDGHQLLAGCHDAQAGLDRLRTISGNGKVRVVIGGDSQVNFPSWGAKPEHHR